MQANTVKSLHTRRLIVALTIIGSINAVWIFIFLTEYSLIRAEMALISEKLLLSIDDMVGHGSVPSYITAMFVWFSILVGAGYAWAQLLFKNVDFFEKVMFSLVLGAFIMPLSFVIPAAIVSLEKLVFVEWMGGVLPEHYNTTVDAVVTLLASNHEQAYELFNVFLFACVGIIALALNRLFIFYTNKKQETVSDSL